MGDDAKVHGQAKVSENAFVYGKAQASGTAQIHANALVFGNARVLDSAKIYDRAEIYGNATVFDPAETVFEPDDPARNFNSNFFVGISFSHHLSTVENTLASGAHDYVGSGRRMILLPFGNRFGSESERLRSTAIFEFARVSDNAKVWGESKLSGDTHARDMSRISGGMMFFGGGSCGTAWVNGFQTNGTYIREWRSLTRHAISGPFNWLPPQTLGCPYTLVFCPNTKVATGLTGSGLGPYMASSHFVAPIQRDRQHLNTHHVRSRCSRRN